MIDPLSCLREYTIKKQPIVERNNYIIFGEYCWPKSVKTNYRVFNKQQDAAKEYYTLECLLFLLNNLKLSHVAYVNLAKKNDLAFIRRPDRKKLLAYLMGEISTSPSIDTSAPVVYPTIIKVEQQKEITDAVRDSNFQSSYTIPSSEASISKNKCLSSFNYNCIAAVVKPEREEQEEINTKLVKPELEEQEEIIIKPVKPEIEEQEVFNTNPSTKEKRSSKLSSSNYCFEHMSNHFLAMKEEYSVLSSPEASFTINEKQIPSLQKVKQVIEDHGKINKKRRIENFFTLSSSESSISRKEDQIYSNLDHNSSTEKQEAEEKDEIDMKPSTEELLLLVSNRRNISLNEEFSTLQRVKLKEGKNIENQRNKSDWRKKTMEKVEENKELLRKYQNHLNNRKMNKEQNAKVRK